MTVLPSVDMFDGSIQNKNSEINCLANGVAKKN